MTRTLLGLALAGLLTVGTAGPALAIAGVDDHLPEFLNAVGEGTGEAWVAFEVGYSKQLDQLFYKDRSVGQKLSFARAGMGMRVPVWQLRTFSHRWRGDFEATARQAELVYGRQANLHVSMWYALDTRVGVFGAIDGKPTLALNARHMLPYDSGRTRMLIAQELFRYYVGQAGTTNEALTLSRRLQIEGLNLAAMQRVVPGQPMHRYLNVSPAVYQQYRRHQAAIARGLKAALEGPESANAVVRYFGGGMGDPWPNGAGKYMAMLLAATAARDRNPMELYILPSRDYLFQVLPLLDDLARIEEGLR